MTMRVLYGVSPNDIKTFDTARLRAEFLIEGLYRPGHLEFAYTHVDRMIVGAATPASEPLTFGDGAEIGTPLFFTAREMGVANLGGAGKITVDGETFALANRDVLYIGRGAEKVTLTSDDPRRQRPSRSIWATRRAPTSAGCACISTPRSPRLPSF
jgi:4-deoxy-L-threo-5-hexosulose-uronate ketol-isomerase